jgi:UDP-N-acetyl-D-mannosaminuronate dehydrogenase
MNEWSKSRFAQKVVQTLFNTITMKKVAVLGFAFKKNTGDTVSSACEAAALSACADPYTVCSASRRPSRCAATSARRTRW